MPSTAFPLYSRREKKLDVAGALLYIAGYVLENTNRKQICQRGCGAWLRRDGGGRIRTTVLVAGGVCRLGGLFRIVIDKQEKIVVACFCLRIWHGRGQHGLDRQCVGH